MSPDPARYPYAGEVECVKLLYDNIELVEESNSNDQSFYVRLEPYNSEPLSHFFIHFFIHEIHLLSTRCVRCPQCERYQCK